MRTRRSLPGAILVLYALVQTAGGCARVHYRTHDFHPAGASASNGIPVDLVLTGTWLTGDSAGYHIERRASPYRMFVYVDSSAAAAVEQITVELTGLTSGTVVTRTLSPIQPMKGDTLGRSYANARDLELAYEDYEVRFRLRVRDADGTRYEERTTTLRRKFQQSSAFRFWEALMSV